MPRPGTQIDIVDDAPFGGAILDSGQAFFAGVSERGPIDTYGEVHSLKDYEATFGERSGGSLLYDAVGCYFGEGGAVLYVSRIAADDAVASTIAFGSLTANGASPGTWGNTVTVAAEAPSTTADLLLAPRVAGDPIVVVVSYDGTPVERSQVVGTADDLVTWAQEHSTYVRFAKGADNVVPADGTTANLAGGTNGTPGVAQADVAAALARFPYALGPGQVAVPGLTSTGVHNAVLANVDATRRCALLDLPDSADPTVLVAAVAALEGVAGVRFVAAFAPWAIYPAQTSPATVVVPYSGIQAGLIARADAASDNPNQPAAGVNGVSRLALGLSQTYTDDQREALNATGIDVAVVKYGTVRTYGYRTAAGPADKNWLWFGNSRVIMDIAFESDAIAENYVLRQIDGQGSLFASLHADLKGMLLTHWRVGALYGATPQEAFSVDTGASVNTIATIAAGEIHAVVRVKCSPAAEWVQIDIVKVPVERALAA